MLGGNYETLIAKDIYKNKQARFSRIRACQTKELESCESLQRRIHKHLRNNGCKKYNISSWKLFAIQKHKKEQKILKIMKKLSISNNCLRKMQVFNEQRFKG
jgi:hypothetical protein